MDFDHLRLDLASGASGNEGAILACVLQNPEKYFEVQARLNEKDFLTNHHRALWGVIRSLLRRDCPVLDSTVVLNEAVALKLDSAVGGFDYISTLFNKWVDPKNLDFYINRVADASSKLSVFSAAFDICEMVGKHKSLSVDSLPASEIINHAQHVFQQIDIDSRKGEDAENMAEGLQELLDRTLEDPNAGRGISSTLPLLDEAINGFENGTLTVVGARPKTGKSALLLNWAVKFAYDQQIPVLYIDTEMRKEEQQFRTVSHLAQVPEREIKTGDFRSNLAYQHQVETAVKIVNSGLLLHRYMPGFSSESVSALVRKAYHQQGVRCIVFDYIKLSDDDLGRIKNLNETQALGLFCSSLKNLAGELKIPIITAAQIGRQGANKGRAQNSDLADTDRILRYTNTLLALTSKPKEEMEKLAEEFGKENALKMGTHRLQVLNTRAGGENYWGIDLKFRKETITLSQAEVQESNLRKENIEDA